MPTVRWGHPGASLLPAVLICLCARGAYGELSVRTDFEGASAKVVSIDQTRHVVKIQPAGDPARGWPCWWYLRIDGLPVGGKLTLEVAGSDAPFMQGKYQGQPLAASWAQPERATYSSDGHTWKHTAAGATNGDKIAYALPAEAASVWVAWGPPFTPR